ncbi:flagellar hook-length control protein FliK [Amphibacillus sp. Q70]|uniref:flagellar hook-length control protein FliK n=1 Tax=Amphibacillus sp. Q70 TaxID=3453416 RepID=UPI003F86F38D
MNISALLFQTVPMPSQPIRAEIQANNQTSFGGLINHLMDLSTNDTDRIQSDHDKLIEWLENLSDEDLELLFDWFEQKFDLEIEDNEQLMSELKDLEELDLKQEDEEIQVLLNQFNSLDIQTEQINHLNAMANRISSHDQNEYLSLIDQTTPIENEATLTALDELINKFDSFSQEDAKQLLDLLKQMQETKQTLPDVVGKMIDQESNKANLEILAKVHDNFQKKFALAQKTSYQSDTTVTSKEVLKWVKAAIEQTSQQGEQSNSTFGQLFSQHRTDSSIEQLQIQLGGQVETTEQLSDQLLSKFEQAINQSTFLQGKNGSQQLLLKLAPESLGTIRVELTEMDGEMLVKLTASSELAKEALEANIKELRHMFSPQNIVIEKQESQPIFVDQQTPFEQQAQDEQELNEQEQQPMPNEQDNQEEDSIRFEDVLFQERV